MKKIQSIAALVSIIVPVYNCEKYLNRCIKSIIQQSYTNIELLLIDDSSTDNSSKICNQYAERDNRIKVIQMSKNGGPSLARNAGIQNASGSYVLFVDADDYISVNAVELLITKQHEFDSDLVIGNFIKVINDNKAVKYGVKFPKDEDIFNKNLKILSREDILDYARNYLKSPNKHLLLTYCWGKLYSTIIIKENNITFREDLQIFEDIVFNYNYLKYINNLLYLNEALYNYCIHDNHLSLGMSIIDNLSDNANQLRKNISEFLQLSNTMALTDIRRETGHAIVFLIIVHLVRICWQVNKYNEKRICMLVNRIVSNSDFQDCLRFYFPSKGNSKILPLLMKLRLAQLIVIVCKRRAYKRYGRGVA